MAKWCAIFDTDSKLLDVLNPNDKHNCGWERCGGCDRCLIDQAAHAGLRIVDVDADDAKSAAEKALKKDSCND